MKRTYVLIALFALATAACSDDDKPVIGSNRDAGGMDGDLGSTNNGGNDDAGTSDSGTTDSGTPDMGGSDLGTDLGGGDDAGMVDSGTDDAGADMAVEPISATIAFPGPLSATQHDQVVVRGTSTGPVTGVTIAGVAATSTDGFATWEATVDLASGTNMLGGEAMDGDGNIELIAPVQVERLERLQGGFGTAWDQTNRVLYVVDREELRVRRLDVATQTLTTVVELDDLVGVTDTTVPIDLELDTTANAIYVLSRSADATRSMGLWKYDMTANTWSEVSTATRGAGPAWTLPGRFTLNTGEQKAYVSEGGPAHVLEVDLATGDRTVLSSETVPNTDSNKLDSVNGLVFNPLTDELIVLDRGGETVFSIDVTTGNRNLIASATRGSGPVPATGIGVGLDPLGDRAFVFTLTSPRQLLVIDLGTGNRYEIPDAGLTDVRELAYDSLLDSVHVVELHLDQAKTVDLGTDETSSLYRNGYPQTESFPSLNGCSVVAGEVWAASFNTVYRMSATHALEPVMGAEAMNAPLPEGNVRTIASSNGGTTLYVLIDGDQIPPIIAYDTLTDTYRPLVDATNGAPISNALTMEVNDAGDTLYVLDSDSVHAVDIATGTVSLVSDNSITSSVDFEGPTDISLYAGNVLVADYNVNALLDVDIATGMRSMSTIPGPALFPEIVHRDATGTYWFQVFNPTSLYRLGPNDAAATLFSEIATPLGFFGQGGTPYWLTHGPDFGLVGCDYNGIWHFDDASGAAMILTK